MWLMGPVAPRHVGSSQTRTRTRVPCIGRQILNHCATREAPALLIFEHRVASFCIPRFSVLISGVRTKPPNSFTPGTSLSLPTRSVQHYLGPAEPCPAALAGADPELLLLLGQVHQRLCLCPLEQSVCFALVQLTFL